MRAHLVQTDIVWEDKAASRARAADLLRAVTIARGDLIALPEMFETGFSLNVERTADADGSSAHWLSNLARDTGAYVIGGITVMGPDGRGRNRALVHAPTGVRICSYDKVHPFSFGREGERFTGGNRVDTFEWATNDERANVQPVICYDLRFPELFRVGRTAGASVYVVIANWPRERAAHWRALLIARAIENQAFVLGVNRCGEDPHVSYAGGSIAIGPKGDVLAEAGETETTLSVDVAPGRAKTWRGAFPAWNDARTALLPGAAPGDDFAPDTAQDR